jgi:threonine/homoserine/homoserine lactone efflux protein
MEAFDSRLLGLILFSLTASITPGPNNTLLLSSGKHFGYRRTLPLMGGIFTGFIVLLLLSGFGVASLIHSHPSLHLGLRCVSTLWLGYLAYLIFRMGMQANSEKARLLSYREAFLMQFLNPKAWAVAVNGAGGFMPQTGSTFQDVAIYMGAFLSAGILSMNVWTLTGTSLARLLQSPRSQFIFGVTLSGLMLSSIVMLWI